MTLSWNPPVNNGGSVILSYEIYWDPAGTGNWGAIVSTTATFHTIVGLTTGSTYKFKVAAYNIVGVSTLT